MGTPSTSAPPARPHIVVGMPCFGGNISHYAVLSLLNLQRACFERRIDLSFKLLGGESLVTRARNLVVRQFLDDPSATHLLFVDADIGFDPDQALALLDAGKDIVGAAYPLKGLNWEKIRAHAQAGLDDPRVSALHYVLDFLDPASVVPVQGFARVRYLGAGFMMIRREVFARMAEAYPELRFGHIHVGANRGLDNANSYAFFDCMIDRDSGTYLSEDYTFCRRWTAIGGEIWVNLDSRLTHVGPVPFEGDLLKTLAQLDRLPPRP